MFAVLPVRDFLFSALWILRYVFLLCGEHGQIKTNMEMDSHEERLHNMIQDSKREAAKEEAGRRAKELREQTKEAVSRALRLFFCFWLASRLYVRTAVAGHTSPFHQAW